MRIVEFLLNLAGWFQIVVGAMLIGLIIGIPFYLFNNHLGVVVGIVLISLGFLLGTISATRIWVKHGTVDWLSGIRRIT